MAAPGAASAALGGILRIIGAAAMGAPPIFPAFGGPFVLLAIVIACAAPGGKNRLSAFGITDAGKKSDPLNTRFAPEEEAAARRDEAAPPCGGLLPLSRRQGQGRLRLLPPLRKKTD